MGVRRVAANKEFLWRSFSNNSLEKVYIEKCLQRASKQLLPLLCCHLCELKSQDPTDDKMLRKQWKWLRLSNMFIMLWSIVLMTKLWFIYLYSTSISVCFVSSGKLLSTFLHKKTKTFHQIADSHDAGSNEGLSVQVHSPTDKSLIIFLLYHGSIFDVSIWLLDRNASPHPFLLQAL